MFAIHTFYRLCALIIGFLLVRLGYLLFCKGVYEKAGDLTAAFGKDLKITLRAAAPGIFFAFFGVSVAVYSLSRGVAFQDGFALEAPTAQILEKVVAGTSLEESERRALKDWLDSTRRGRGPFSMKSEFGWIEPSPDWPVKKLPEG